MLTRISENIATIVVDSHGTSIGSQRLMPYVSLSMPRHTSAVMKPGRAYGMMISDR